MKIDRLVKRVLTKGKTRTRERVQAFDMEVVMTTTQAHRFRELTAAGFPERAPGPAPLPDQPWYTAAEAAARLDCPASALLVAAAEGRLVCHVDIGGIRGRWLPAAPASGVRHAALPPEACREIADFGSANVSEFRLPPANGDSPRFVPGDVQFIGHDRILIRHPLPAPDAL